MPEINPLVSIVTPAFNARARVGEVLASVLAQTYDRIEVIVVDDGSTDDTAEAARRVLGDGKHPHRIVRQENKGPSCARNHGWRLAKGEWIQFLDDDDRIAPQKIRIQIEALNALGEAPAFIASAWARVGFDGMTRACNRAMSTGPLLENLLRPEGFLHLGAGLTSRAWLERVGGFDERLRCIEDVDLQLRLLAAGAMFVEAPSDAPLFFYQERAGSLSRSDPEAFVEGCVRNAELALRIARDKGEMTPSLKRIACDALAQGVVFHAERNPVRTGELIGRIRSIDAHYIRKGGLFRLFAAMAGWPLAERVAAKARALRKAMRAFGAAAPG
jgi:glycosyltransferase involved in cell wall biosynthesis